jgi:hypothetical protein
MPPIYSSIGVERRSMSSDKIDHLGKTPGRSMQH